MCTTTDSILFGTVPVEHLDQYVPQIYIDIYIWEPTSNSTNYEGVSQDLTSLSSEQRRDIILGDVSTPDRLQIARTVANLPCEPSVFDKQVLNLPRARQPNQCYPASSASRVGGRGFQPSLESFPSD